MTTRTTQAGSRWQGWPQATETHADVENAGAYGTETLHFGTAAAHAATSPGMQTVNMENV